MHEAALLEAAAYDSGVSHYCDSCPEGERYVRLLCGTEGAEFEGLIASLHQRGFIGVNVTIPFKRRAYELADIKDISAQQAQAANTLLFTPEGIIAYNTDSTGFLLALQEITPLAGKRLIILGACGGAGSAIAWRCAEENFARITLVNRPRPELPELAAAIKAQNLHCNIDYCHFASPELEAVVTEGDIIVNATALGLHLEDALPLPVEWVQSRHIFYDIITHETPLAHAARQAGAQVSTGESMLLWQGAYAFRLWFTGGQGAAYDGLRLPHVPTMRKALI